MGRTSTTVTPPLNFTADDIAVQTSSAQMVETGCRFNGFPVYSSIQFNSSGMPTSVGLYSFDATGALIIMSGGENFQKPAALKPSIDWLCVYAVDTTNETSRELSQRVVTTCDETGSVTGTQVDLFELDKTTAATLLATEVLSKEEQCFSLGQEQADVVGATSPTLTIPAGAAGARVQVDPDGAAVRYTLDGTAPDANSFAASAGSWITLCKAEDIAGFTASAADAQGALDGAATAQLQISYVSTELH